VPPVALLFDVKQPLSPSAILARSTSADNAFTFFQTWEAIQWFSGTLNMDGDRVPSHLTKSNEAFFDISRFAFFRAMQMMHDDGVRELNDLKLREAAGRLEKGESSWLDYMTSQVESWQANLAKQAAELEADGVHYRDPDPDRG